jgi:alpha-L-fucosidase
MNTRKAINPNLRPILLLAFAGVCAASEAPQSYRPSWESIDQRPTPDWFLDAKFGVFIHFGVYSVPAWAPVGEYSEWYWNRITLNKPDGAIVTDPAVDAAWRQFHDKNYGEHFNYQEFAPLFRMELFDAAQWADLFARSGVKYVVLTSKHHDGFALWPSADATRTWGRPWNAAEIGPKRDVVGEVAQAVRAQGLKFGIYYSLYEWFNPLWETDRSRYAAEHMQPQFKDVVTRYRPSIIFADGEWDLPSSAWGSEQLLAWLFNDTACKDDVVINDRWGSDTRHKHGGYWTTEYGAGLKDGSHPWEESRGMAYSYGYNRAERASDYKSAREFVLMLVDLVSRGGNLLLDVGPDSDGTIPPLMQERLLQIGDWLRVNGEAIYGTRCAGRSCQWSDGRRPGQEYGKWKVTYELLDQVGQHPKNGVAVKQVFFTKKPGALYAIAAGWPGKKLVLRNVRVPANVTVTMLGVPGTLKTQTAGESLTISTPDLAPDGAPCQFAYTFEIQGGEVLPEQ